MKMTDLFEDIRDGVYLLSLLEVLSGETLVMSHCTVISANEHCITSVSLSLHH